MSGGARPGATTADAGGDTAPADAGGERPLLQGTVLAARSADLSLTAKLPAVAVRVVAMGAGGREQATVFANGEPFTLRHFGLPSWLRVEAPDSKGAASDWLTTLQAVESVKGAVSLLLFERQALADVSEALQVNPVALDPNRAQALLYLVDAELKPLPGASVQVSAGIVAYDTGVTFSDAVEATSERGAVALFNAPAAIAPGIEFPVLVTRGTVTTTVQVPLVKDAVTLMVFEL